MAAIDIAVEQVTSRRPILHGQTVHILTDCQSALQAMTSTLHPSSLPEIVSNTSKNISILHNRGSSVTITWIAGHAEVHGNVIADRLAKEAAYHARNAPPPSSSTSYASITKIIKKNTVRLWQRRWNITTKGRWTYQLQPNVTRKKASSKYDRSTEVKIMRMLTGQTKLRDHMHRVLPRVCPTPTCDCEHDRQTIEHVLLHCPLHKLHREEMMQSIDVGYQRTSTPSYLRDISLFSLLGTNPKLSPQMQSIIASSLARFIKSTNANF
nr:uncharacterized protein LOC129277311 [Lytechinus pictus]